MGKANGRDLGTTNTRRLEECWFKNACLTCGEELDDIRWIFWDPDEKKIIDLGGMHEKCMKLTANYCPHLNEGLVMGKISARKLTKTQQQDWKHKTQLVALEDNVYIPGPKGR